MILWPFSLLFSTLLTLFFSFPKQLSDQFLKMIVDDEWDSESSHDSEIMVRNFSSCPTSKFLIVFKD